MDWAECVHSALQRDGMDGGTAAGRPAGGTGGTDCPESGGSSPAGRKRKKHDIPGYMAQLSAILMTYLLKNI